MGGKVLDVATVKYNTNLQTGDIKIILKEGKVSCICCGKCCSLFNCESLLDYWRNGGSPEGYESLNWELVAQVRPSPDPPPQAGWIRDHGILTGESGSCIRFVCINSVFEEGISTLSSQSYCGPTCTNLDLFSTVVSNVDGSIFEETGCFIFALIFYGWVAYVEGQDNKIRRRFAQCSDTAFAIHYAKLNPIAE